MPNIFADLHSAGYVILPQKISIPKTMVQECRTLFANKKVTYTFNGPSLDLNDKKRYVANIVSTSPVLQKINDVLAKNLRQYFCQSPVVLLNRRIVTISRRMIF